MAERPTWTSRVENGRVALNPDHPDNLPYYQDTDERGFSDSGCPGAGFHIGPALLEHLKQQNAQEQYISHPPMPLNPTDDTEIWE